jgi:superfamily II DNA or RNA helicase
MAVALKKRSTLVVAPTLDLVRQWFDLLGATFGGPIGLVGGGEHDVQPLTVTTYDSAFLHMDHLGRRFGLVVFDECHHLPSGAYAHAARACLAPFRLGLTATPARADGRESELDGLIGPFVYRKDIVELSGDYLAEYAIERISIELSSGERAEHDAERAIYREFVKRCGIRMGHASGWSQFILLASQSEEGRRAMASYRRQRELAFAPSAKLEYLEHLLHAHRRDRAIVFTQDNATAYAVARRFLVPVITHQTKVRERSEILAGLAQGTYRAVATSKVLNEGVDVPDANVAVILSGSGSVREHVQRLGRILRKQGDKRAVLYELVTDDTTETYTSQRRREHSAYR